MDQGLSGKRVLLTGGSKGIGRVTALAFADAGATVVAGHRTDDEDAQSLNRELEERGSGHRVVRADVTTRTGVTSLASAAADALGGLDVLVNNVGVDGAAAFGELPEEEWHRVFEHNVTAAYLVTQAVLGLLGTGASIVNIGSSVALRGRANGVHYSASKSALTGFTRALAKDLGPRRIRVNMVAPGLTETEPGAGLPAPVVDRITGMTPLGRLCDPADVAGAVLFFSGDTSRYISGATLNVDGGI